MVATLLLACGATTLAVIYDWLPDVRTPIFFLQIPFLAWRYTWSASLVLAFFDTTGFLPAEVAAVYFWYLLVDMIIHNYFPPREEEDAQLS